MKKKNLLFLLLIVSYAYFGIYFIFEQVSLVITNFFNGGHFISLPFIIYNAIFLVILVISILILIKLKKDRTSHILQLILSIAIMVFIGFISTAKIIEFTNSINSINTVLSHITDDITINSVVGSRTNCYLSIIRYCVIFTINTVIFVFNITVKENEQ